MFVKCSKCKARLRVTDENIRPDGSSIKCHECSSVIFLNKTTLPKETIEELGSQPMYSKLKYLSDINKEIKNKTKNNPFIFAAVVIILLLIMKALVAYSKSWQTYVQQVIYTLDF